MTPSRQEESPPLLDAEPRQTASNTPTHRALVIINPLSGRGRGPLRVAARRELARTVLGSHGLSVVVREITGPGEAGLFAREAVAEQCDVVVVWGGDGTVNGAAAALAHSGVTMAIVPGGSGNGLARDLGVPLEPHAALTVAATGRIMTIDAGEIDGHLFFNVAGVGIDAVIAARFAERPRAGRGMLGYLQLGAAELLRYRAQHYHLTLDQQTVERHAMLIALANGRQYGNRVWIAPGARLDDGCLEVVIVDQLSMVGVAYRLPALFRGTLRPGRGVSMQTARTLHIRAADPIPYHVDGEPRLGGPAVAVHTHPAALRVKVPAASLSLTARR